MNKFLLIESRNSPRICFDSEKNVFEVSGRSFPENADKFYKGALMWLENFKPEKNVQVSVNFKLQYISSASVICVLSLLKKFENLSEKGCDIIINWMYQKDDEDIKFTGQDLESLTTLNFEYSVY